MCLIAVAIGAHPRWRFVLAGNRDEVHARPTAPADVLDADGQTFGGRDLVAGGGWLQVDRRGRVAAVTNVRRGRPESASRSRGDLVAGFIASPSRADDALSALAPIAPAFGRFNLLLWDGMGDGPAAHYASNHPAWRRARLDAGVHTLSNADLDTPWPKTRALREAMMAWLDEGDTRDPASRDVGATLFAALADPLEAEDGALPDTGVGLAWERRLSAAFIVGEDYGTRASTLVLVGDDGLWFEERRFGPLGRDEGRTAVWLPRR